MSLLAGLGSLAGNLLGGAMSNSASKANTERSIRWERERATNAHQWEVKDMTAAGLNPILSATGGSGAQTGSVNAATNVDQSKMGGEAVNSALNGINTANQLKRTDTEIKSMEADKTVKDAQARLLAEQALESISKRGHNTAQQQHEEAKIFETMEKTANVREEIKYKQALAELTQAEATSATKNRRSREFLNQAEGYSRILQNITGAATDIIPMTKGVKTAKKVIRAFK